MFRASSCPSSGATTAVAASDLPSELGDISAVGRGRAGRPVGWLVDSAENTELNFVLLDVQSKAFYQSRQKEQIKTIYYYQFFTFR
jgi:hypothetical protein